MCRESFFAFRGGKARRGSLVVFNGHSDWFIGELEVFNGDSDWFNGELEALNGDSDWFNGELSRFNGQLLTLIGESE
ncbi:hypothetical protein TMU01_19500 [Tenuibacillus multivorans]|nr:hypothetical protein TMU01_19500 [Tenuibacillus multivorans]